MLSVTRQSPYFRRTQIYHGKKHQLTTVITQILVVHVMGYVTGQLAQPYRVRPNEDTLAIFTEFSLMANPSFFLPGQPGETASSLAL
jgi:exosome complex RNA-binding protein Rrp42 (RNase PH superfamily)